MNPYNCYMYRSYHVQ